MSDIAIYVENLGKRYRIGERQKYKALRDTLANALSAPFRSTTNWLKARRYSAPEQMLDDHIWAIRDVSFTVKQGEVVGVIGRNGAGKSTLLKILSRIAKPTEGYARMHGRIGSLLEVGTGFHPELTGRENAYLNGAILGMTKREIEHKFDEIVAFAEVEKFIDTPVKHYSSGMYVRLAFGVAAHLEPEILLVDEVLAVGDAAFQKKCLGKMEDVAREGRTVLFVSHNMGAVQTLCHRGILLGNSTVLADCTATEAVSFYLKMLDQESHFSLLERTTRRGKGQVRLANIEISEGADGLSANLATGRPIRFVFEVTEVIPGLSCGFTIYDQVGQPVAHLNSAIHGPEDTRDSHGGPRLICELDELLLLPGRYRLNAALYHGPELQDHIEGAAFFDVEPGQVKGRPIPRGNGYGSICLHHRWILPTKG